MTIINNTESPVTTDFQGIEPGNITANNMDLILSDRDLTSCIFSHIAFMEDDGPFGRRVNPLLGNLARVNKLFSKVVQVKWKKEYPCDKLMHKLWDAAYYGHADVIKELKTFQKFNEIPVQVEFGLGAALRVAARFGHLDVIKELKTHPNFKSIPANGWFGLGDALLRAALCGRVDVIKELKTHPNFNDIPASGRYGLGAAYRKAAENGHTGVIKALKTHPNFRDSC